MYSAHNGHIPETLHTQHTTKIIRNSNNLIEVPLSIKSEGWLVRFGITCHICCIVRHSKSDFDSHFRRDHNGTITYTCTPCGKQMDNYHNYRSHCYRHGTQLKCPHCDKSYPELSRLVTHVNANHKGKTEENEDTISVRTKRDNKNKQFQCPECPKKLVSVSGLQFHIKTNHQSVLTLASSQDFTCGECGKVLKSLAGLQSHTAVHQSAKQYACNFCKKIFIQPTALKKHTQTEHTGHKPYCCSLCPLEFDSESFLKKHLPFHNEEREFLCTVCNKCFKTKRCLKVHSRLHLKGISDIPCPTCGKRFLNSTKLRQHINIHNGERPYSCKYCTSTFTNFSNWRKHTRRVHKVDHKTGESLTDLYPEKDTKNNNNVTNNDNNSNKQNMSNDNEKEIFDANNLFDDANQETINPNQSSSLAPFSAKKHDLGIFDNNGNYRDEIKKETKTSSIDECGSINFSNFYKRVKLDTKKNTSYNNANNTGTTSRGKTISAKNYNKGFTPEELNSESHIMTLCNNNASVNADRGRKSKNTVHSDKNVPRDSIPLISKEQTVSVQFDGAQRDFTASVVSTSNDTVSVINNAVAPLQTTSNIPMLLIAVPTANNTDMLSGTSLNISNNNYARFEQNTIEPKPPQPLNFVYDKPEEQKYVNVEQKTKYEDIKMSVDQLLNENKHEQNVLTKNMTHIIIIYDDFQKNIRVNNNNSLTTIGLDNSFMKEQQFINTNVLKERLLTESRVIPLQKCLNNKTEKQEFINNNITYGTDNIVIQEKLFESFNTAEQQKLTHTHDFSNRIEVEEQVVTGNNITESKTEMSNFISQAQPSPDGMVVQKHEFINKKQKQIVNQINKVQEKDLTKLDRVDIHISKELALSSNSNITQENKISNNSLTNSELFKNNINQKNQSVKEITDYSIAEVMHLLNKNISDDLELIDNKKCQEQELPDKKIPQEKEKNLQPETILNKIYRQEELGFKNNTYHEMLNNNICERQRMDKELERCDLVSDQRRHSEVTYTSVNLTSALGLDEGSLLAHIDPHLTFKLSQHLDNHTSLSNSELHLNNDVFIDNTCDSIPESLLASGTETLLMNCRNLRMMTEDDTRASRQIEPMDIFDQDLLNIDVQDVLETLKNITSTEEIVDSFLNLEPIDVSVCNEMLDVSKEPQPYISGDFLVVPPPLEM